jgi:hypothetical protein
VIVANGTPALAALHQATRSIPVVFVCREGNKNHVWDENHSGFTGRTNKLSRKTRTGDEQRGGYTTGRGCLPCYPLQTILR